MAADMQSPGLKRRDQPMDAMDELTATLMRNLNTVPYGKEALQYTLVALPWVNGVLCLILLLSALFVDDDLYSRLNSAVSISMISCLPLVNMLTM